MPFGEPTHVDGNQLDNIFTNLKIYQYETNIDHALSDHKMFLVNFGVEKNRTQKFEKEEQIITQASLEKANFDPNIQKLYKSENFELFDQSGKIELEKFIEKITIGPRKIMGLPNPVIKENEIANLVVFNPNTEWHLNDNSNYSKSVNSPYYNKKLKGKILFTANQFKSYKSTF